jgi:hypothetical protein
MRLPATTTPVLRRKRLQIMVMNFQAVYTGESLDEEGTPVLPYRDLK